MKDVLKKIGVALLPIAFAGLAAWTALGGLAPEIAGESGEWLYERARLERRQLSAGVYGMAQMLLRAPQKKNNTQTNAKPNTPGP